MTGEPPDAAGARAGSSSRRRPTRRPPASSCSPPAREPESGALDELVAAVRGDSPLRHRAGGSTELIPDRFEYRPGATYVGSTVQDLLDAGAGVCQDFVHLGLILLRRNGIAARYVSGYLWAAPEEGGDDSVEVETHAWLEALLPGGARGEPIWRRRGSDEPPPRRRDAREDRPRPDVRGRPADQGRLPRVGDERAGGARDDDARRP